MLSSRKKGIINIILLIIHINLAITVFKLVGDLNIYLNYYGKIHPFFLNCTKKTKKPPPKNYVRVTTLSHSLGSLKQSYISWDPDIKNNITEGFHRTPKSLEAASTFVTSDLFLVKNAIVNQGTTFIINNIFYNPRKLYVTKWYEFFSGNILIDVNTVILFLRK